MSWFSRNTIKFHENPSSGSWGVTCGWTGRHNEATVAFHNFANAPKNNSFQDVGADGRTAKYTLREIQWDGMDLIPLAEDMDKWQALVDTVINL
jgi:hypothetical protein